MKAIIIVNLAGFLTFLWNDIETLQKMGFEVSVAMNGYMLDGSEPIEKRILKNRKIQFYQIDFNTKNPFSKQNITSFKQLKTIFEHNKFDLIHCHTPIVGMLTRLAAIKCRRQGTKVIYTTHGFSFTDRTSIKSWVVYYSIEKIMSKFCDAIITINHEDYQNAKKMHCKKVYIIPGVGIDSERFQDVKINRDEYRKQFGVYETDIMVLAVGELSSRKNHRIIIDAISLLPNKNKFCFVICGKSVVNSALSEELITLAKIKHVRLFLAGHRFDIPEINKCADIAVIPSKREGLGMAGLEAMASGVPVVGSDVQGIREYVVQGITGYLCNSNDAEEFAVAIEKLSAMSLQERDKMELNCKNKVKEFDVRKSIAAMKNIYREVMDNE